MTRPLTKIYNESADYSSLPSFREEEISDLENQFIKTVSVYLYAVIGLLITLHVVFTAICGVQ